MNERTSRPNEGAVVGFRRTLESPDAHRPRRDEADSGCARAAAPA